MTNASPPSPVSRLPLQGMLPILFGGLLFAYLWLGPQRFFPPFDPWLSLAVVVLLSIWWLYTISKKRGLVVSPLTLPMLGLLGTTTLATATSIDRRLSLDDLLLTLACTLAFLLLCDLLSQGWRPDALISTFLATTGFLTIQGLAAIANWFWYWYQLRVADYPLFPVPLRLFTIADQPNLLASILYLSLPWIIFRFEAASSRSMRLGYGLWCGGITTVLFFTRSRGGWVTALFVLTLAVGWLVVRRVRASGSLLAAKMLLATTACYLALFGSLLLFDRQLSPVGVSSNAGVTQRQQGVLIALETLREHPLTGSGPFTFGRIYVEKVAATRAWVDIHPHNLYADLLAQRGLLGFGALVWIVVVALRYFVPVWAASLRDLSMDLSMKISEQQRTVVAASISLAGCLIHGLIDVPVRLPYNALFIVAICALAMHALGTLRANRPLPRLLALAVLLVPLILGSIIWRYGQAQESLLQGILAGQQGDWPAAARALDDAVASDPQFAFYHSQRAFAYGMVGETSAGPTAQTALSESLQLYRSTIQDERGYTPHLLNAASVAEQLGDNAIQKAALDAAATHPDWPLALLVAADQRPQDAADLYAAAFRANPRAADMAACRRSASCRNAAAQITFQQIELLDQQAQELLQQDQPQQALELLRTIPVRDPTLAIWIDRAAAHLALDQLPQARYALSVASTSSTGRSARLQLVRAALNLRNQQTAAAIASLEQVARPTIDEATYSYAVFLRVGLPGELLPSVDRLQHTPDDLTVYRQLADLYAAAGRTADADWARGEADALSALLQQ